MQTTETSENSNTTFSWKIWYTKVNEILTFADAKETNTGQDVSHFNKRHIDQNFVEDWLWLMFSDHRKPNEGLFRPSWSTLEFHSHCSIQWISEVRKLLTVEEKKLSRSKIITVME